MKNYFPGVLNSNRFSSVFFLIVLVSCISHALVSGDTTYYQHIVFDNSLTSDYYFYSWGQASGASLIKESDWRLPVETKTFLTPPNALRIEWQSQAGGGWEAEIRVANFRYRYPIFGVIATSPLQPRTCRALCCQRIEQAFRWQRRPQALPIRRRAANNSPRPDSACAPPSGTTFRGLPPRLCTRPASPSSA